MKKITTFALALMFAPAMVLASGGHVKLDDVKIDMGDQASLQRGARLFVNYCLSCHSASYMRYNRMASDLGISEDLLKENLMFASDKSGELMKAAMPRETAIAAFNVVPPDLSVTSRSRGARWIYTYMRSFYRDEKTASGWNNSVFPNVAMPHVLHGMQGEQRAIFKKEEGAPVFDKFEMASAGSMSEEEYDRAIRDLTNFMVYMGEPAQLVRYQLGVYVLLFLIVLFIFSYMLKKEYWKDVH